MPSEPGSSGVAPGFSCRKRSILLLLKSEPNATLARVAQSLGTSRAAAWKHLARLEDEGHVQRDYAQGPRGRPHARFRLSSSAQSLFPQAYAQLTLGALAFIDRAQGRDAVVQMLEERAQELRTKHRPRLAGKDLSGRVRELTEIRDEEGYLATSKRSGSGGFDLVEHNCPILMIAEKYGESCEIERRLFRDVLGADVTVRHRVVAGDPICQFLIRPSRSLRTV
jgi:predicted ArsR family transcriptional regulator